MTQDTNTQPSADDILNLALAFRGASCDAQADPGQINARIGEDAHAHLYTVGLITFHPSFSGLRVPTTAGRRILESADGVIDADQELALRSAGVNSAWLHEANLSAAQELAGQP